VGGQVLPSEPPDRARDIASPHIFRNREVNRLRCVREESDVPFLNTIPEESKAGVGIVVPDRILVGVVPSEQLLHARCAEESQCVVALLHSLLLFAGTVEEDPPSFSNRFYIIIVRVEKLVSDEPLSVHAVQTVNYFLDLVVVQLVDAILCE
jgi:hypothetical protein